MIAAPPRPAADQTLVDELADLHARQLAEEHGRLLRALAETDRLRAEVRRARGRELLAFAAARFWRRRYDEIARKDGAK